MVDSILTNCIIKPTAFKSFHNPVNFKDDYTFNMFGREERSVIRKAYIFNNNRISIQAGDGKYSSPREFSDIYYSYELGFPNFDCEYLKLYAEDVDKLQKTVYGYVPWQIVIYLVMDKLC
jgi:hypothetical protein